jgi:SpoIVB peptidase S55
VASNSSSERLTRRHPTGLVSVVVSLAAVLVAGVVPAGAASICSDPPDVFPVSSLRAGQTAVGHTVIRGTDPTDFDVEILGVLPDGIAPGLDFILAQITGPADFLAKTGGIVAGMSGSPVYIGHRLVGSTSYGFFAADQTIMGITPAQPMVDLFGYGSGDGTSGPTVRKTQTHPAKRVPLSPKLRQTAARAAGTSASEFPAAATQLPVPLGVSGLTGRGMTRLQHVLDHYRASTVLYRAGAASAAAPGSSSPLEAGQSLAAGLSYGDLTLAGIGTATATCADMVVGFGHPFTLSGRVRLGMNGADVLTVIKDPSNIFGGFKMANVTDLRGSIDQDRFAGIRGVEGDLPALVPLTVRMTNADLGRTRAGETDIVGDLDLGPFFIDLPIISAFALLSEEDVAFDRIGDGSVSLQWTIEGTAPDGTPFTLRRDDKFYSSYDATFGSIFELYGELQQLQGSRFGKPSFSGIDVSNGTVTQRQLTTKIVRVLSASSLQRRLESRSKLVVRRGDVVHLRAVMRDHDADGTRPVDMYLRIPRRMDSGGIEVRAGRGTSGGFFGRRSQSADSFSDLVSQLAAAEHNYDLVAELTGGTSSGGEKPVPLARSSRVTRKTVSHQDDVVRGRDFIRIVVR